MGALKNQMMDLHINSCKQFLDVRVSLKASKRQDQAGVHKGGERRYKGSLEHTVWNDTLGCCMSSLTSHCLLSKANLNCTD